ncbi:TetR/AcrR family transcriptional regulator [Micromonospora endolithica]|uniref:TetR/AcrR family transcriptional regulator n=1 Tax=Micromonospora endolithica TaxID=230091 RepID=A0A3A9YTP0_9ACTN|nr:TetR/AcrR family transcriptional regulator [Micromonospora endolithica]RKN39431.1 TetR/AcrR family transcriptional regulator [Micromonospora endolithica]
MSPRRAAALRGGDRNLREHLIATAERLIAGQGAGGLTVRAIAREAGVADGVLYNHFADKEELLAYALHARVRAAGEAVDGPPPAAGGGPVAANLRTYLTRALALHAAILPAFTGLLHQPAVLAHFARLPSPISGGTVRAELAGYLRAEQRLGRVAPHARPDAVAALVVGVCHDLVLGHLLAPGAVAPVELSDAFIDDLVATLLHGVAPGDD